MPGPTKKIAEGDMTDGGLCLFKVEGDTVHLYMRLDDIETVALTHT